MFPLASFIFSILGLLISTYTDFRWRIIPNWIPASLAILGVGLAGYESYSTNSLNPLFWSVGIMVATYIVAYLFWRLGAWAGGDVKLFTGLAALNPFNPFLLGSFFNLSFVWGGKELLFASSLPVFMLNLFMLSVLMLFPYTAFLALSVLHHREKRVEFFSHSVSTVLDAFKYSVIAALVFRLVELFVIPYWVAIPVLIIVAFLPDIFKWILAGVGWVAVTIGFLSIDLVVPILVVVLALNLLRSWYAFAQKHVLTQTKKISQLEEGDIPGEVIALRDGKIVREPGPSLKTIIKAGSERNLSMIFSVISPTGELLANPRQAAGFYPDQIARLQSEVKKGVLSDEIKVKASAPFAPAVLFAYVVLSFLGDGPLAWWYG